MKYSLFILIVVFFALSGSISVAQTSDSLSYNFGMLRQKDDFTFLKNIEDKSVYQSLKYTPIFAEGFISFGAGYRNQFEFFKNQGFQETSGEGWFLNRLTLHSKLQINSELYIFSELFAAFINSKKFPSPVDRDELALSQAFIKYQKNNVALTVGRINPTFGANRIIAFREGPNVRRYFDGISASYFSEKFIFKGFYYQPVDIEPFGFDNNAIDGDEYLYGLYTTLSSITPSSSLDLYYIGRYIDTFEYSLGFGSEDRHSLGFRYFGKFKKLDFDLEGLYQFGTFENQDINAYTISLKADYPILINADSQLILGFKTEYISGDDDPNDDELNTFNALYPRGAYFGRVAQFGPMNLVDIHPSITYSDGNWSFFMDYVAFWRASKQDAVYGAGLNLSFPDINDQRFIGHQYGAVVGYTLNSFLSFEVEANYITAGNFLKLSSLDNNLFHFVSTIELKL